MSAPVRSCSTGDDQLRAFAAGVDSTLDEHVAGCDECQAFLADVWIGELDVDLSEPVVKAIRFELFLLDVAKMFVDVATRMGQAAREYLTGDGTGTGPVA